MEDLIKKKKSSEKSILVLWMHTEHKRMMCQWGCVLWMPLARDKICHLPSSRFFPPLLLLWYAPEFMKSGFRKRFQLIGSMIFEPTFENFKKKAMNKKKYLKGTLPTVFASVEKENLKKKPHFWKKKLFSCPSKFWWKLLSKCFAWTKNRFFCQSEYSPPKKCTSTISTFVPKL